MKVKPNLALWLTLLLMTAPASARLRYVIDQTSAPDGTLKVSLQLPPAGSRPSRLVARPLPTTQPDQIRDVRCDGQAIERSGAGWTMPDHCRTASWTVSLIRTSDIQASEQRSIWLNSGWGIVTDPSAILRPEGFEGQAALRFIRPGASDTKAVLPSLGSAPGIYLIGDPPTLVAHKGDQTLVYAGDVLNIVRPAAHQAGLAYLRRVIGPANLRNAPVLTVIWLGVKRSEGSVGGAAGADAVLVNYILPDANSTPEEALKPLVIVIHEEFHQLVRGRLPLWARESLAQFYGLKTLSRIEVVDQAAAARLRDREFAAGSAGPGLAAVQAQVQKGDPSNYNLFYSKGVAFWHGVDLAIQSGTGGARSLDDVMPTLLGAEFDADGSLPEAAIAHLPPSTQEKVRALEREFL